MDFQLKRAEFDHGKQRAYVEIRAHDDDGGEAIVTALFSYRTTERHSTSPAMVCTVSRCLQPGARALLFVNSTRSLLAISGSPCVSPTLIA